MFRRISFLVIMMLAAGVFAWTNSDTAEAQVFQGSNWQGNYYSDPNFTNLSFSRVDPVVQFSFTGAVTGPGGQTIGPNNYSVRWTTTQPFAAGNYTFGLTRMDDARVLINGVPIIDFGGQDLTSPQFISSTQFIPGGNVTITVELRVLTAPGTIQFNWQGSGVGGNLTPTAAPTATRTPLPPIPPGALTATVIRASVLLTRNAPSLGGQVVGRILRGETYQVIGRDEDARWFLLQLGGYQAWSWGYYLFINGNEFNAPVRSPFGTIGVPPGVTDTGVVAQSEATLRLRAEPNVASAQIGRVTWGGFLPVIGRTADGFWYQVVWKGTVGWVYSPFVEITQGDLNVVPVR